MDYNLLDTSKLRILSYPDPALTEVSRGVTGINREIVNLVDRMSDLMMESSGVGLAAPQVGVPLRIIVFSLTGKSEDVEVLINPALSKFIGMSEMEEGCLSIPGVRTNVRRPEACTVEAMDIDGNEFVMDAVELGARILQHETDHLDGILFIERLNTVSRMACRKALKEMERQFEENNHSKKSFKYPTN